MTEGTTLLPWRRVGLLGDFSAWLPDDVGRVGAQAFAQVSSIKAAVLPHEERALDAAPKERLAIVSWRHPSCLRVVNYCRWGNLVLKESLIALSSDSVRWDRLVFVSQGDTLSSALRIIIQLLLLKTVPIVWISGPGRRVNLTWEHPMIQSAARAFHWLEVWDARIRWGRYPGDKHRVRPRLKEKPKRAVKRFYFHFRSEVRAHPQHHRVAKRLSKFYD